MKTSIAHISILWNAHGPSSSLGVGTQLRHNEETVDVDVLACSHKVSHPKIRLVSAAIGVSYLFSLKKKKKTFWTTGYYF
jgi:hypothetical protein